MAGKSFPTIDVIDLSGVRGGGDQQTDAAKLVIDQATRAVDDVARSVLPKNAGMTDMLLQLISQRRPGPGPSSAPALPPTSTLTR